MQNLELITLKDLETLKAELITEITKLVKPAAQQKQWLKSYEVRKLLGISPGTLQTLRVNGTLPYSKVGGTMYYSSDDLDKLIQAGFSK